MPANLSNAKHFLLSTDYPMDKVLETLNGSFTATARYGAFQPRRTESSNNHTVGSFALIDGVYSTDGGATWLPFGIVNADTSGITPTFQTLEVTAYCTTSAVVIVASNYTASDTTVNWRLRLVSVD